MLVILSINKHYSLRVHKKDCTTQKQSDLKIKGSNFFGIMDLRLIKSERDYEATL